MSRHVGDTVAHKHNYKVTEKSFNWN